MRVVVTGASGLIGSALVTHLRDRGHNVTGLVRANPKPDERTWDPARGVLDASLIADTDAVVHLAGAGIGDHRWTPAYRRLIRSSRVDSTALLARTIAALGASSSARPSVLLSGSAVGIYGDRGDEALDESSTLGTGFLCDVCREWEAAAAPAAEAGVRVAHLRTGIVLSADGGALKKLLPLFRLCLGGRFGKGHQWQSWISVEDEVAAIEHLLTAEISGPVDLTSPNPVTNAEFTTTLAKVLHRPAVLPVPRFAPRALLGRELADVLLFEGQRVLPTALQDGGYEFRQPELAAALRAILNKP